MSNPDGWIPGTRTFEVNPVHFAEYLIKDFPHTTLAWVQQNTSWLTGAVRLESEPTPAEMAELEIYE